MSTVNKDRSTDVVVVRPHGCRTLLHQFRDLPAGLLLLLAVVRDLTIAESPPGVGVFALSELVPHSVDGPMNDLQLVRRRLEILRNTFQASQPVGRPPNGLGILVRHGSGAGMTKIPPSDLEQGVFPVGNEGGISSGPSAYRVFMVSLLVLFLCADTPTAGASRRSGRRSLSAY